MDDEDDGKEGESQDGSPRSLLERLFVEQHSALERYFQRHLRGPDEPAELAQEVFLRMSRAPDPDQIRNPEGYLFTIAANIVKERLVVRQRDSRRIDIDDPQAQEQLAVFSSAGASIDAETLKRHLYKVLQEMRPKQQAAVVMHFWHGMTYQEVADRLGVSINMVKKLLKSALELCRRRMSRFIDEWQDDDDPEVTV